ncbi:protein translocase subunit SecF [Candidatus Uhrbacteria bacterium]|nr:protein translocase subunit SecF [Candidatus Uhrbacteria bacterium]
MLPIIRYRKIFFVFSGLLIAAALLALGMWRLRLGTDFVGGSLLEVRWPGAAPAASDLRAALDPLLERDFAVQQGAENNTILRSQALSEEKHQEVLTKLKERHGTFDELRFDSIGPVIGRELIRKSIWALVMVLVGILLYIAWSFRKVSRPVAAWKYGVITILTGFHDVIIPLGLFSVLGKWFDLEVNASFVAAILTVLGYSINDTIVVLDRVRENLAAGLSDFEATVEKSVNQALARSLNTILTTLLALVAVFFFGGETTKHFVLALIVGIATGAYSSIFIASPLLVVWHRRN